MGCEWTLVSPLTLSVLSIFRVVFQALNENKDLVFVRPAWLFKCHEEQKLVDTEPYVIPKIWWVLLNKLENHGFKDGWECERILRFDSFEHLKKTCWDGVFKWTDIDRDCLRFFFNNGKNRQATHNSVLSLYQYWNIVLLQLQFWIPLV